MLDVLGRLSSFNDCILLANSSETSRIVYSASQLHTINQHHLYYPSQLFHYVIPSRIDYSEMWLYEGPSSELTFGINVGHEHLYVRQYRTRGYFSHLLALDISQVTI